MSKQHAGPYVTRFNTFSRVLHACLVTSFLGLAGTGLPLLFSHARWAWWLSRVWGGFTSASILHRFFALVLIGTFVTHLAQVAHRVLFKHDWGVLWGPRSLVPRWRDFKDLFGHMRYFVGLGPRPRFDRFTYWEKFDYWAVFWGMVIIGGSGLLLWFPTFFTRFVPGWLLNVAEIVHGEEALLAVGFIFTVHFINSDLRPEKFPMDTVIFTGRLTLEELKEERPEEYERLEKEGRLSEIETTEPSRELMLVSRVAGLLAITIGLTIVVLIFYASITH